jgi:hypothetical protein
MVVARSGSFDTAVGGSLDEHMPVAERLGDELCAGTSTDLVHGIANVTAHRVMGDLQLGRDLWAAAALRDVVDDLKLAWR